MSSEILFNENILENFNTENKKNILNNELQNDFYIFEIPVEAKHCSWNYIERYPVDAGDFIFYNDIDADDFAIIPDQNNNKLSIKIKSQHPFIALEEILSSLFNERSQQYNVEFGYSGWDFNCNIGGIVDNGQKIIVDIKKYDVDCFQVEAA